MSLSSCSEFPSHLSCCSDSHHSCPEFSCPTLQPDSLFLCCLSKLCDSQISLPSLSFLWPLLVKFSSFLTAGFIHWPFSDALQLPSTTATMLPSHLSACPPNGYFSRSCILHRPTEVSMDLSHSLTQNVAYRLSTLEQVMRVCHVQVGKHF